MVKQNIGKSTLNMSTAERRAFQKLCDEQGHMLVLAIDQRNAMRNLLVDEKEEIGNISNQALAGVKADLVRHIGNHSPAVLLDPEIALPQIVDNNILSRNTGLVVSLDASGWKEESNAGLRQSQVIAGMTPRKVRQLGGDAAKMLVYMRPDIEGEKGYSVDLINELIPMYHDEDVLLVIEILVYRLPDETLEEYEKKKPALVRDAALIAGSCGAKVLKIQFPGTVSACKEISQGLLDIPWAVLSAGVDHEMFLSQLNDAMQNGANGAIAGRAIWKDCVSLDAQIRKTRMQTLGVPRIDKIKQVLDQYD